MSSMSFLCLYCWLWTCFTPFSSVSIFAFEQVNVGWVFALKLSSILLQILDMWENTEINGSFSVKWLEQKDDKHSVKWVGINFAPSNISFYKTKAKKHLQETHSRNTFHIVLTYSLLTQTCIFALVNMRNRHKILYVKILRVTSRILQANFKSPFIFLE